MEADATRTVLMYFILPLWMMAAFADWLCHRAADIEHTAGPKETLIHLALFAEMAIPVVLVMHFEVNAFIIAIMILCWALHEATAVYDVFYATDHRIITPIEQWVHSYLGLLPLMSLLMVTTLNWSQFLALIGMGVAPARFDMTWKQPALPLWYHLVTFGGALVLVILPYIDELRRGLRATGGRIVPLTAARTKLWQSNV